LHFEAGKDEGRDALQVVVHDGLADIVIERSVAHAAGRVPVVEARHHAAVGEAHAAVAFAADEFVEQARIALPGCGLVGAAWGHEALVHRLGQGVDKHAGGGGLTVVAGARSLVHHLPPDTGSGILPTHDAVEDTAEHRLDGRGGGLAPRKVVQLIDNRHGIPADRAGPEIGGMSGEGIGPQERVRGIPGVVVESAHRIVEMLVGDQDLMGCVCERARVAKERTVVGVKGPRHVEPIEPYLIGIYPLVIKSSLGCPRLILQLPAQVLRGLSQLGLMGLLVELQDGPAWRHQVEVVLLGIISANGAVRREVRGDHMGRVGAVAWVATFAA